MAIPYLPTEIFEQIVTQLSSMTVFRFDNARKRDLQSLRLVSHRFRNVATPFLFRNLRIDTGGLRTMRTFCSRHPELARHVHGLQLVFIIDPDHQYLKQAHDNLLRIMKEIESQDKEHAAIFLEIVLEPFAQRLNEAVNLHGESQRPGPQETSESLSALAEALPNLNHLETTHMKSWSTFFINGAEAFYNQTGRIIDSMELDDNFLETQTGIASFMGITTAATCNKIESYIGDYVSLQFSAFIIEVRNLTAFFPNLHTLDIGIRASLLESSWDNKRFANDWIKLLNQLSSLSTLRLVLTHDVQHVHTRLSSDRHKFFLDDVFLYYRYGLNDQRDGYRFKLKEKCKLAKLKSVSFKNWAVTASGLHYLFYAHRNEYLEVRGNGTTVAFDPAQWR